MTIKETAVPFVLFPNYLLEEDMETHLTAEELYLYATLYKDKNITNEINTTVSLLSDYSKVKFFSKRDKNMKCINENLISLQAKEIIHIVNFEGEVVNNFKSNDSIRISFVDYVHSGYTTMKHTTLDKFENPLELLIFINVARWHRAGSFNTSYARWARLLKCSPQTAISRIKKAIEKGIIYKNIGNYVANDDDSQKIQEINSYRVVPFDDIEKTVQTLKYEESVANIQFRKHIPKDDTFDISKLMNKKDYSETIADTITIFSTYEDQQGYNIYPNEEDYFIYIQTKASLEFRKPNKQEEKFMNIATKRIQQLEKNNEFIDLWNIAELRFIEMVNKEEYQRRQVEQVEAIPLKVEPVEDVSLMF